jgi:CubicO group peptidase (beta-lactamase class C family)
MAELGVSLDNAAKLKMAVIDPKQRGLSGETVLMLAMGEVPLGRRQALPTLGDGGIYSSIDDLAKWEAALCDDRLLRPASLHLAFQPATPTDDPAVQYGFGWRVTGETLWHSGETTGFRNIIVRHREHRLTVVILTNRDDPHPHPTALTIAGNYLRARQEC